MIQLLMISITQGLPEMTLKYCTFQIASSAIKHRSLIGEALSFETNETISRFTIQNFPIAVHLKAVRSISSAVKVIQLIQSFR